MKRIVLSLVCLAYALGASTVSAQVVPDFSGLWKQNMEKSSKTSLQSYANRIEQKGDTLKVVTISGGSRGENSYERTYVIGKETTSTDREGDHFTSIVKWEGRALVFLTTEQEKAGIIETRENWTLSPDSTTLTKVRTSHGPRGDQEQHYVLEKGTRIRIE
jgi:hypothetical protein